ncbi:hypothetical protein IFM89_032757 [Coptis chinensis]|uniref:HAT C-terminal dimerisation domain-containing protein n=1 Tax=Coptis chinensis TaxID=261450 RepID=A0A835HL72_9MAGN|nr:hypothetical protein IFM89_032757 [Coptis chinensis]
MLSNFITPSTIIYGNDLGLKDEFCNVMQVVIRKLLPDGNDQADVVNELKNFREAKGDFSTPAALSGSYGTSTPKLRKLAIRILSQTTSSSGCERNWSTFGLIHSKRRNRLRHARLEKLVFVHYNLRLRVKHMKNMCASELALIDLAAIFDEEVVGKEDPLYEWVKDIGEPTMDGVEKGGGDEEDDITKEGVVESEDDEKTDTDDDDGNAEEDEEKEEEQEQGKEEKEEEEEEEEEQQGEEEEEDLKERVIEHEKQIMSSRDEIEKLKEKLKEQQERDMSDEVELQPNEVTYEVYPPKEVQQGHPDEVMDAIHPAKVQQGHSDEVTTEVTDEVHPPKEVQQGHPDEVTDAVHLAEV